MKKTMITKNTMTIALKTVFKTALTTALTLVACFALVLTGCQSKKKVQDEAAVSDSPQVDNAPMNFNAQGSDSGQIAGLQSISFDYDKSSLSNANREKIKANAEWLKARGNTNLQIEGHCDSRGSIEYNLALGERRARTVKDYMVSVGIAESRLSVISYGKEKPLDNSETEAAYGKNRRANFVPIAQ
jgi:peptidoglycan-associated lipoprotein